MRLIGIAELERVLAAVAGEQPRVVASGNHAAPRTLLDALDRSRERYRLFMLAAPALPAPRDGVIFETPFVGPGMRTAGEHLDYLPMRLSLVPRLFATARRPAVVLLHTSTPQSGKVSLGIEVNVLVAAVEQVRARDGLVVAQLNPRMPYTFGDSELDEDLIDLAVEVDEPLASPAVVAHDERSERIAELVAALIDDGTTLQLGIGQIPDATLRTLTQHRNLTVWSEMISDGVMALERYGALEQTTDVVCSFLSAPPNSMRGLSGTRACVSPAPKQPTTRHTSPHRDKWFRSTVRWPWICTTRREPATSTDDSTPVSGASLTSLSVRYTRPAGTRSSHCVLGMRKATAQPLSLD